MHPQAQRPLLLVCDHASYAVPAALQQLGLSAELLAREHNAWDLGAAALTLRLAERLQARAILSGYSRLVIDCNRAPGDPSSVPSSSDGIVIPGNQALTEQHLLEREEQCFWPYHHAITQALAQLWRLGRAPIVVSIHSFTPQLRDCAPRPWEIGVLWNHDPRMALPMLEWLRQHTRYCIGDNQPYSGRSVGFTLQTHAEAAGLAHILFEVRQDQLADAHGVERWAELLSQALSAQLSNPLLHQVVHF